MGFPVGYTEVFLPNLFLQTLSILGYIRNFVFMLFRCLGLSDYLETEPTEVVWSEPPQVQIPVNPPLSAILIRGLLPVIKYQELTSILAAGDPPESCAVCLYEFEGEEEIRWLRNCKHIFHMACLDRWMDHDHKTCPLCRTPFVSDGMQSEFNQRLWAAAWNSADLHSEYGSI